MRNRQRIAKISAPKVTEIFLRKRLFQLIDRSREKPVTWIAAPAGSGKTTLIASWLAEKELPALWYQVDKGDDDIATFFHYLGLAVKNAASSKRQPLPHFTPEYLMGVSVFARRYFENLYDHFKPPFSIVFDNYHEAPDNSPLHDIISIGMSLVPEGIRLFVLSRKEPPPAFARLRANGDCAQLGWAQLKFTREEAKGFIRRKKYMHSDKSLDNIHRITDGWAAGLVLLTEEPHTALSSTHVSPTVSPEKVFDYFVTEVLEKLDSETRDFLIMTSLLPKMTFKTARKLSGMDNAGDILASLHGNHFFTEKLGSAEPAYQYHPLFRHFLLARLKESLNSEGLFRMRKKAAQLLEQAGQIEDSAQMYCDIRDWERFISLVLSHAQTLFAQGRWKTLSGWIESIPEHVRGREPWLLYWMGVCYAPMFPAGGKEYFRKAFELFKSRRDSAGQFLSLCGMIDSIAFGLDTFGELDLCIERMNALRRSCPKYPSPEIEARVVNSILHAIYTRQPHNPDVRFFMDRGLELAEALDSSDKKANFYAVVGFILTFAGEFEQATLIIESLRKAVSGPQTTPFTRVLYKDLEACHAWMSGDFGKARTSAEQGIAISEATGVRTFDLFLLGHGAAGALCSGDLAGAGELIRSMKTRLEAASLTWAENFYHAMAGWKCLCENDLSRAAFHADLVVKLGDKSGIASTEYGGYLLKALVLHAIKNDREALSYIAKANKLCRKMKLYHAEFLCLLVEAAIAFSGNRENRGAGLLRSAMKLGRERGFVNSMYWQPVLIADLCVKALERSIELKYVRELITRRNLVPSEPPLECDHWPWPVRIFTLGRFQLHKQGKPAVFSKKAPKKTLVMLKVLVALGGQAVPETRLIDILWPDADGDAGHNAFEITLNRLRELLSVKDAVVLKEGCVTLDQRLVWVDVRVFEHLSAGIDAQTMSAKTAVIGTFEKALGLYQGVFLPEEAGEWSVSLRERMRSKFLRCAADAGRRFEEKKEYQAALPCYLRGIEVDELIEELYQRAMICYMHLGRNAEALSIYKRCKAVFASYGVLPSVDTEALRKNLMK